MISLGLVGRVITSDLREENVELLCGTLSRSKQLRTLILSDCKVTNELCHVLLLSLHKLSGLKILNLHSN